MADRHLNTNRLIREKSPYLLQHAHNPVDWYPWGEEAFDAARLNDRPIFLSIGYATCHWCHVMERECFEDSHIAQLMNETFINIKVDREELPEIDSLYMEFAQSMMAGAAGWPLNVIITPDLQPFFAATYLPPESRHGLMGLNDVILRIREVWQGDERDRILQQAEKIVEVFAESVHTQGEMLPEKEQVEDTAEILFKMADPVHGGMKGTPKFPIGYQNNLLLHYSSTFKDSRALFIVERTLDMMQRGGIYDHLGGGFSRYSVDENWLVPHFEKMLYDNALLIYSYLEAWQVTKKPLYRQVCDEIIDYVLRDMTHPDGGFYSAEDADSEGKEGLFYTWTPDEVYDVLGKEPSELLCHYYDITDVGNFEGRSILHTSLRIEEFSAKYGKDPLDVSAIFREQKHLLFQAREKRVHPFKDDKVLASWNGLMIHSLSQVGAAFSEVKYLNSALRAAQFMRLNMWEDGLLLRRWRDGEANFNAGLDEYAYVIQGLLSLFMTGLGTEWLEWALEMTQLLERKFKTEDGAFFQTDGTDSNILLRKCQFSDGAEPSGNAVHCENLLNLYHITRNTHYLNQAEDVMRAVKKYIDNYAPGYCYHLMNINRYYDRHAPTLVVALNENMANFEELRQVIFSHFIPHKAVIWRFPDDKKINKYIDSIDIQAPIKGNTTLYICYEGVCKKPLIDLGEMIEAINKL